MKCPNCQSDNLKYTEPRADGATGIAFRCINCLVMFVITNPSRLKELPGKKCLGCRNTIPFMQKWPFCCMPCCNAFHERRRARKAALAEKIPTKTN